jgi:hypothetical protein
VQSHATGIASGASANVPALATVNAAMSNEKDHATEIASGASERKYVAMGTAREASANCAEMATGNARFGETETAPAASAKATSRRANAS